MNTVCNSLLQLIYDHEQNQAGSFQISADKCEQIPDTVALRTAVQTIIDRGYAKTVMSILGGYCLALTEKGEAYVRNGFVAATEQQSANFNFSGATINNAMIGNNNTVGSMNYNSSAALDEIQKAISRQPSADQAELNEMLDILRDIQRSEKPVEKSRLARFYELVKKSSDLVLPISKFLFEVFFKR